jgi:hypothetical protein
MWEKRNDETKISSFVSLAVAVNKPPCSSIIFLLIARPIPVPPLYQDEVFEIFQCYVFVGIIEAGTVI